MWVGSPIPSARRRSALPFRLFAVSIRCRSRSSFSDAFSTRCGRATVATRDLDFAAPLRPVVSASSESSAFLSDSGDADRELVFWRFEFSGFLRKCQQRWITPYSRQQTYS